MKGLIIALLLLPSLVAALAFLPAAMAVTSGPNPPLGLHLSYLGDPTTATFTWHTAAPASSRAEWGASPGPPYPNGRAGTDYASPGGTFLHTVTATGLTPGTRYFYRVGDAPMTSWSGQWSFRAALASGSSSTFSFAAAGDWGITSRAAATAAGVAARGPDLVLGLGDYYYAPDEASVRSFYGIWEGFATNSFAQLAMGNHELGAPGDPGNTVKEIHCAFVNLPGNERSFAFTYGNTFFLTIDWGADVSDPADGVDATGPSCGGTAGTGAIRAWADAQLAAADADPAVAWKAVFQHYLCYDPADSAHYWLCPGTGNPDRMEDIMVNRGVDLVLQAHDHIYGRTHPVRAGAALQTGSSYGRPDGPIYVVLGTGGEEPRQEPCRTAAWVAACRSPIQTSGFGHFTVSPTAITYEFVENTAGVVDRFTLSKGSSTPPSSTSVSFQQDDAGTYSDTDDTFLFAGAPTTNYGANDTLRIDGGGCVDLTEVAEHVCRALIKFPEFLGPNPGQVPLGATIVNASLEISVTTPGLIHDAYQVTEPWTEGGATWNSFATPGFPANRGLAFSYTPDRIARFSLNVTSIVQNWANGDVNEGLLFATTSDDGAWYASAESTLAPRLIVTYQPIEEPPHPFDFSVSVSPTSRSVTPGESATTAVTATLTSGTPNTVAFSAGGLPAGTSASFAPSQCGPTCSTTATLATSTSTPPGTYTISMRATDGTITRSATFTLLVASQPPPFDFSLSASPDSRTVSPGQSTTTSVTATLVSGEPNTVSFGASGLPSGATASFSPSQCVPTCSSTATLATSTSTPAGTYSVTMSASDGYVTRTTPFTLVVSQPPPPFDFALSANPSSGEARAGESVSTSVTATLTSGESTWVSFSASGLPSGAAASFTSGQCLPTCTSTMRISTSTYTPTGTFSITVRASGGGIQRSTTFTLYVAPPPPPPDFSIRSDRSSMSIGLGGYDTCSIILTSLNGFSGYVGLSVSIRAVSVPPLLPTVYPTAYVSPTTVALGAYGTSASTLKVSTSLLTTPGTYEVTVTATSGSITHSVTITVQVTVL